MDRNVYQTTPPSMPPSQAEFHIIPRRSASPRAIERSPTVASLSLPSVWGKAHTAGLRSERKACMQDIS
ncbi:hypothetical protein BU16DRAFT_96241 [Lophium mytilinum]|uniref:Uncharacterized protein n=1 Tax=Lophium mytilinum TaxID=390894 RepID=A0A6A6QLM2_9PEZI|nr:hypothetical protein BU16DRAFT_96241 [Lophium mytilinum]